MPRALTALVITAVAAFLLFSFKPAPGKVQLGATAATTPAAPPPPRPHRHHRHRSSPTSTPQPQTRTIAGDSLQDPYGTVQVSVKLRGGRIVDVTPTAMPLDNPQSQAINQQASPLLRSEVLQAQSASVDIISGATYTSEAYARSVQSALLRARG
jgi:uncharacterized protein with FMN-binding domain